MAHISDIKLIRTDTTLDLSQKAEKGLLMMQLSTKQSECREKNPSGSNDHLAIVQRQDDAQEPRLQAAVMGSPPKKINLISCKPMAYISDIKLIRTDTTLDLSQKAEKGMLNSIVDLSIYTCSVLVLSFAFDVGLKFWFRLEVPK
ncbi:hypothetical protein BUALT_Bualt10G0112100 [Buddleja alternifolia]|uniref:Uncharacterized protein n=1 Tax=Buddleja alternifolia TaxID=168488 RepID=A0AAV6WXX2_9LAMI|nr:hypothetical protein BUALT_Bualt10G0112100 [Buddleja alternifolia]